MIAVDTNVVIRLIVGDDERQVELALALLAREGFFISLTVLIETEWVLRSRYGYGRERIHEALTSLHALSAIEFEAGADADWALDRYADGGELADYVHIVAAREIGRFTSFERKLARRAGAHAPARIELVD